MQKEGFSKAQAESKPTRAVVLNMKRSNEFGRLQNVVLQVFLKKMEDPMRKLFGQLPVVFLSVLTLVGFEGLASGGSLTRICGNELGRFCHNLHVPSGGSLRDARACCLKSHINEVSRACRNHLAAEFATLRCSAAGSSTGGSTSSSSTTSAECLRDPAACGMAR